MYYVYMLSNKYNNVLYTGVTKDIKKRTAEHKQGIKSNFARKYNCDKLVYYKEFSEILTAIAWEKKIKKWPRDYKNNLVASMNPLWEDLSPSVAWTVE